MGKMVKCKTCGQDIAKTARVCPSCGAKQHNLALSICAIIIVLTIILCVAVIANGGNSSEPQKVDDSSLSLSKSDTSNTKGQEQTTFGVGEKVSLNDIVVTLVSVKESNGANYMNPGAGNVFIICEFEIENDSSKDIAVSSIVSFETYVDDYSTNMSLSATVSADNNQLDGSVAAGKKMNGVIGYEAPSDWGTIEIRFTPDFWSNKDITFVYSK